MLFVAIIISITGVCAFADALPSGIAESIAIISDFKGGCSVKQAAASGWQSVSFGMPVYEGDEFKTDAGSFVEITFDDATLVRLDENANLKVAELKRDIKTGIAKTIFNLTIGKMLAIVDKLINPESSFEVHTKSAVAAVKGTQLGVNGDEEGSTLGVFDGSVLFTDKDGNKGVRVGKGFESSTDKDGRPGEPGEFKKFQSDREKIGSMLEDIRKIQDLRKSGKLSAYFDDKNRHGSINPGPPGNSLKDRLRKELRDTRRRGFVETAYASGHAKQDAYEGRTTIDAKGNRIRFEEYVVRPVQYLNDGIVTRNEVDYINLTNIGRTINMIKTSYNFLNNLPDIIPSYYWSSFWDGNVYLNGPDNYLTSKNTLLTNGTDKIETSTIYSLLPASAWAIATNDHINIIQNETMSVNGKIEEDRYNSSLNSGDPLYTYVLDKQWGDDQTWVGPNNPDAYSRPVYVPYFEERVNPSDPYDRSVYKHYNDGTVIRVDYNFISGSGLKVSAPLTPAEAAGLMRNDNMWASISSNAFSGGSIDIVSKFMWFHYMNILDQDVISLPVGALVPDFSPDYWDLLNPRNTLDTRIQYIETGS